MMSKLYRAKIGIAFTALALIFSIFGLLLLNGSTAWYSQNDIVKANGIGVKLQGSAGVTASLKSYAVPEIDSETGEYIFDTTEEVYELPTHDPNSISYLDREKALVIELTVTSENSQKIDIKLSASSAADTINGIIVDGKTYVNNYISNCIKIRNSTLSTTANTHVIPEADSASKKHIEINGETASKVAEIPLLTVTVPAGTSKYYFIIEYDSELLSHISKIMFNQHQDKYRVNYLNDIDFVIY
jgi:hypothetical protein